MQVVPVIDFQAGRVVRATGGRRAEYRPLTSRLTKATDPVGVARAIRNHYGLSEIYVADLDAITGNEPAWGVYDSLRSNGFRIWVDAGVRTTEHAMRLVEHVDELVLGLESIRGPQVIEEMAHVFLPSPPIREPDAQARKKDLACASPPIREPDAQARKKDLACASPPIREPDAQARKKDLACASPPIRERDAQARKKDLACASGSLVRGRGEQDNRLIFSLDLRNGRSLGNTTTWGTADPLAIAHRAIVAGITRMIVLDLARVGGTTGLGTESLCAELARRVQIFAGGGVRGRDDLRRLEALGVTGALVASAIHEGIDFD